jgi:sodium/proline symporter
MNLYYLISFVSYFAFFLGLSIYFYKKNTNSSSFIIGNRSMNHWVTAISAQASDMSDWLFMGYPGLIYAFGLFNVWVAIGLTVFMFLNWHFIAPRLRTATEEYQSLTLASFFEYRFKDTSGTLRLLTVFFTLFFISFYIAAELIGLGRLFETTFGINYNLGIAISIFLVVLNILIGGFVALAWSDLFRGLFLLAMIVLVPVVAVTHVGNWQTISSSLSLSAFTSKLIPDYSLATLSNILLLATGWGLGYFGSPHILINFMGIKDPQKIHKAKYIGITWQILVLTAATIVGLVGTLFFTQPLANRELVFVEMVKSLFNPLLAGFILCAILAATMSVMTAQILATASIVSEDLFKRMIRTRLQPHHSLWLLRGCVVAIPLIAYLISFNSKSAVNDLVSYAWSGLGLAFAPIVIAALYAQRVNKYGAIAGMALGGSVGIIWPYLNTGIMPLLPGFIVELIVLFGVSALTEKNKDRLSTLTQKVSGYFTKG